ncbi:HlyD family type I secretion periplasmic adaptor subunit [Thiomicrospira microaerophila]|uniref:HlyD family type I secretion periplasmic adaptor subunit n=1 Tax=Thiomicrospira microaerophila TaxID=406020 RepID=UPI00200BA453|nr:HlyD family type I secretion periplasmic adaptor subunit [Thiomicrospira microaerophila]UQB41515.1 HlyD family type I secretion periplasmic adaptor subunit [Thiomicrospira microaerophila]
MSSFEQKSFEQLGKLNNAVGKKASPLLDRVFNRWFDQSNQKDWVTDAEWAKIQQEPVNARALLYGVVLVLVLLIIWAFFAELDEISRGEGKVIPSQQLQVVQSLDGGIVEKVFIREGQTVNAGDVLIRIDQTRFLSGLMENRSQYNALSAEVARLSALADSSPLIFPEELVNIAPEIVLRERRLYESNLDELNRQLDVFRDQLEQRNQDLKEAQAALEQHRMSLELAKKELAITRPLLRTGAVSELDILRLEHNVENTERDIARAQAIIQRSRAAINEANSKIRETKSSNVNRWRTQLSESAARLKTLVEAETGLADKVKHAEIRSPVNGVVQRLFTNTIGGVVTPGREVVEIIPIDDQLIVEAKISPRDIAFIHPGQAATIKLTAYDFLIYGGLNATVEHISPDTITDERDNTFYLVRLKTEERFEQNNLQIIPGMTAQVDIITGKKTLLEYLLKPVTRATSNALTER